ncbi:MAG: chromate transporter [Clostridia bacterium]|nr:chromate transporter [Clostridia bacterium]
MIYLTFFFEFFKTGLFAVGGGLATLPFLSRMADTYPWLTHAQLADMIAVAESSPGPIGVNCATYAGFHAAGIPGAIVATFSLILPSYIIMLLVARALEKYRQNKLVDAAFSGLRPAVTGLIAAAGWSVFLAALFAGGPGPFGLSYPALGLFALLLALTNLPKLKNLHPVLFIAFSAVVGLVFNM